MSGVCSASVQGVGLGSLVLWCRAEHWLCRLRGGGLRGLRRERSSHESARKLVGWGVLKGDRAVGDCFGTAAGLDEELGQVGAQPDVIGSGFYGTC